MIRRILLAVLLTYVTLPLTRASDNNDSPCAAVPVLAQQGYSKGLVPVELLQRSDLAETAKDLTTLEKLNRQHPKISSHLLGRGLKGFRKHIMADGFGAGLIVVDAEFDLDPCINFTDPKGFKYGQMNEQEAHGMLVAAAATSVNPDTPGIAAGAQVYPVVIPKLVESENTRIHGGRTLEELLQLMLDIEVIEAAFNLKVDEKPELMGQAMDSLSRRYRNMLDKIENTLQMCRDRKQPMPRVINMSLGLRPPKSYISEFCKCLVKILKDNDILLVLAAGNEGRAVHEKKVVEAKPQDRLLASLTMSLTTVLNEHPDLAEHLLLVCAGFDEEHREPSLFESWWPWKDHASTYMKSNKPASYTNFAGNLKDHALMAEGSLEYYPLINEDGKFFSKILPTHFKGTSFAAPRVAALALLLGKYFPSLNMQQIKNIILGSAFKPAGYDPLRTGQGSFDPLQAWIEAVKVEKASDNDNHLDSGLFSGLWSALKSYSH
jgi:hypothetical protein